LNAAEFWNAVVYQIAPEPFASFDQLLSSLALRLAIAGGLSYVAGSGDVQGWGLFAGLRNSPSW